MVGGDTVFYFVIVTVHQGASQFKEEARIESQATLLAPDTRTSLESQGVKFIGRL